MADIRKQPIFSFLSFLVIGIFSIGTFWMHYQQLCLGGKGSDVYISDLLMHLGFAQEGKIYSLALLLIGIAFDFGMFKGVAAVLTMFHLMAVAVFALGLRIALPQMSLLIQLICSVMACMAQAVWIPYGGYWYAGTVTGTIYHNTTYIMLAPFSLLTMLLFYRVWKNVHKKLEMRVWVAYTTALTLATSFKPNFIVAFAPALLVLLIADLISTQGKNLKNEIIIGTSVFPGVALCLVQTTVLFASEKSPLQLIFMAEFDPQRMVWGLFTTDSVIGLLRSFVFVASVAILLGRWAWKTFTYRFGFLVFCVAMAEALLLVENGIRMYDANMWWGPFVCYWIFLFESVLAWCRSFLDWCHGQRTNALGIRLLLCGLFFAWHCVSGIYYWIKLVQGASYAFAM